MGSRTCPDDREAKIKRELVTIMHSSKLKGKYFSNFSFRGRRVSFCRSSRKSLRPSISAEGLCSGAVSVVKSRVSMSNPEVGLFDVGEET